MMMLLWGGCDVYYYICWRLKLEGETENICVCTKERRGVSRVRYAEVLMATPIMTSLLLERLSFLFSFFFFPVGKRAGKTHGR